MKFIIIFCIAISTASAAVWSTQNQWNDQFEEEFKIWMSSNKVHVGLFTDKKSPYYGIKADCADVTYALKAIFSFNNNLPFQVKNPVYRRTHKYKYWSNEINKFNKYKSGYSRLIKFINFLGDSLGTETLVYNDSYPISLNKITSGDFHAYKKKTAGSGYTRHAHNIKAVTATGNFQLIWSNQQRKKEGRPMKYAEWSRLLNRPYKWKWGFRRMKRPDHYSEQVNTLPDYGIKQFALAKTYSDSQYFKYVKRVLKTADEDPQVNIGRQLKSLCVQANERIDVISSGERYRKKIKGRCMNYKEFDEYSTPARDERFLALFNRLKEDLQEYKQSGLDSRITSDLLYRAENIFYLETNSVDQYCGIKYISTAKSLYLDKLYKMLSSSQMSSHPNDNIHRRWGFKNGKKTNCKRWY